MASKLTKAMFSRESDEWETPQDLYDALNLEFKFSLDAAATQENRKCLHYIPRESDALTAPWFDIVGTKPIWLNPPYSKIGQFMEKAYREAEKGCTVVCLIPSRTDTRWWHDYVMKAQEIRLIKGRLKFGGSTNSAPFPSAIVIFRGKGLLYGVFSSFHQGKQCIGGCSDV